jgi:hypothetical protein
MMTRQARSSAVIMGFDTHMILGTMPAPLRYARTHQAINRISRHYNYAGALGNWPRPSTSFKPARSQDEKGSVSHTPGKATEQKSHPKRARCHPGPEQVRASSIGSSRAAGTGLQLRGAGQAPKPRGRS